MTYRKKGYRFGESHHTAKLTTAAVIDIYQSKDLQKIIAAKYGISQALVSQIKHKAAWRHLTEHLDKLACNLDEVGV